MLLSVILFAVILKYASAWVIDPIMGTDPKFSPQQLPNVTLSFGDMALTPEQYAVHKEGKQVFSVIKGYRWKDAIIPYIIDCSIENYPEAVKAVTSAMRQWQRKTCIRFVKWTNEKYKLTFFRNTHCWGNVGQVSYSRISVGPGCDYEHVMAHEIGHAIGFYHEHNREDRDQWVTVNWGNVGKLKEAFNIVRNTKTYNVPYNYESIMHYPWTAFSSNGQRTMTPRRSTYGKVPYVAVSKNDILLTSRMYDCPAIERKRRRTRRRVKKSEPGDANKKSTSNDDITGGCVDHYKNCKIWAISGACSRVASVRVNCKKSCAPPECHVSLASPQQSDACRDTYSSGNCRAWKGSGYCKTSKSVQTGCKQTCNLCSPDPGGACRDNYSIWKCRGWKRWGYCRTYKSVKKGCKKTCNLCSSGSCADSYSSRNCVYWKKAGYCRNLKSVQTGCKKTCNLCGGKPRTPAPPVTEPATTEPESPPPPGTKGPVTKAPATTPTTGKGDKTWPNRNFLGVGRLCIDHDNRCANWARQGNCNKMGAWMLQNCLKSCSNARCDRRAVRPPGTCNTPLGLHSDGSGRFIIPDSAFSSATQLSVGGGWDAGPKNARLYFEDDRNRMRIGAWCAASRKPKYVQVDLQRRRKITYIATQGRDKTWERVSKFKIQYGDNGYSFRTYKEGGKDREFIGNCDHSTPVLNKFNKPIRARYIRYIPTEFNYPCVRMEFYGC